MVWTLGEAEGNDLVKRVCEGRAEGGGARGGPAGWVSECWSEGGGSSRSGCAGRECQNMEAPAGASP